MTVITCLLIFAELPYLFFFASALQPRENVPEALPDFLRQAEVREPAVQPSSDRRAMQLPHRPSHHFSEGSGVYEELPENEERAAEEEESSVRSSVRQQFEVPYAPGHEPEEVLRLQQAEAAAAEEERRRQGSVGQDGMNRLLVAYGAKTRGSRSNVGPGATGSLGRHKVSLKVPQLEKKQNSRSATDMRASDSSGKAHAAPNEPKRENLVDGAVNFMLAVLDGKLPEGTEPEAEENPFGLQESQLDELEVAPDRGIKQR